MHDEFSKAAQGYRCHIRFATPGLFAQLLRLRLSCRTVLTLLDFELNAFQRHTSHEHKSLASVLPHNHMTLPFVPAQCFRNLRCNHHIHLTYLTLKALHPSLRFISNQSRSLRPTPITPTNRKPTPNNPKYLRSAYNIDVQAQIVETLQTSNEHLANSSGPMIRASRTELVIQGAHDRECKNGT